MAGIGTLRETGLHAGLKTHYAQPGDLTEAKLEGFVIDILRGDSIIEIQTHNFAAIRRKLTKLATTHAVHLIHPIAVERWIVRLDAKGVKPVSRRKSPKRGNAADVFTELVSFPELLANPNFTLEVVLVREEEVRTPDATRRRRWGRDYRVSDRRLVEVVDSLVLACPADCARFVPAALAQPFTTRELARAAHMPQFLSQKLAYCLRRLDLFESVGRRGRAYTYVLR